MSQRFSRVKVEVYSQSEAGMCDSMWTSWRMLWPCNPPLSILCHCTDGWTDRECTEWMNECATLSFCRGRFVVHQSELYLVSWQLARQTSTFTRLSRIVRRGCEATACRPADEPPDSLICCHASIRGAKLLSPRHFNTAKSAFSDMRTSMLGSKTMKQANLSELCAVNQYNDPFSMQQTTLGKTGSAKHII